jgi:hypothetical protein
LLRFSAGAGAQFLQLVVGQLFDPNVSILSFAGPNDLVELRLNGDGVPILSVLKEKTIKKVTTLVPLARTSCHVSE